MCWTKWGGSAIGEVDRYWEWKRYARVKVILMSLSGLLLYTYFGGVWDIWKEVSLDLQTKLSFWTTFKERVKGGAVKQVIHELLHWWWVNTTNCLTCLLITTSITKHEVGDLYRSTYDLNILLPLKLCHHLVTTRRQYPDWETTCKGRF